MNFRGKARIESRMTHFPKDVQDYPVTAIPHVRRRDVDLSKCVLIENDPLRPVSPTVFKIDYAYQSVSLVSKCEGPIIPWDTSVIYLRGKVIEALLLANEDLKHFQAELVLYDGYRTLAMQSALLANYRQRFKSQGREASFENLHNYIHPVEAVSEDDPNSWPPHCTGAAVDIVVADRITGKLWDMGAPFDSISDIAASRYFERRPLIGVGTSGWRKIQRKRRILFWTMVGRGFSNYPLEWWHYDYKNPFWMQYNIGLKKRDTIAIYGMVT